MTLQNKYQVFVQPSLECLKANFLFILKVAGRTLNNLGLFILNNFFNLLLLHLFFISGMQQNLYPHFPMYGVIFFSDACYYAFQHFFSVDNIVSLSSVICVLVYVCVFVCACISVLSAKFYIRFIETLIFIDNPTLKPNISTGTLMTYFQIWPAKTISPLSSKRLRTTYFLILLMKLHIMIRFFSLISPSGPTYTASPLRSTTLKLFVYERPLRFPERYRQSVVTSLVNWPFSHSSTWVQQMLSFGKIEIFLLTTSTLSVASMQSSSGR